MTEKKRLLNTLAGKSVDRPPFIIPGGLINKPFSNRDVLSIVDESLLLHDLGGVENLGIPFTMRVEAEAYGGEKEDGFSYPLKELKEFKNLKKLDFEKDGSIALIIEAIKILRRKRPDVPIIGDMVGPLGLATSLVDASILLKSLVKNPSLTHSFLSFLSKGSIEFARCLIDAGADCVFIVDPFSTVETLGKGFFREFSIPHINTIADEIHKRGVPVIAHLCGDITDIGEEIKALRAECISIDCAVKYEDMKKILPDKRIMGNMDSFRDFPHIVAPSCRLWDVEMKNLKAIKEAVLR